MIGALLAVLLAAGAMVGLGLRRRRDRIGAWRAAARECGLTNVRVDDVSAVPALAARAGRMAIRLEEYGSGTRRSSTRFIADRPDARRLKLSVGPSDLGAAVHRVFDAGEIALGDRDFDRRFVVLGAPAVAAAVLSADTRALMTDLQDVMSGVAFTLRRGEIRADLIEGMGLERCFPAILNALVDLAERLPGDGDILARLCENAHADPEPAVRLFNLRCLAQAYAGDPAARAALEKACEDQERYIRLFAAKALGEEGRPVLLRMALGGGPDQRSAEAVAALGALFPVEDAIALFERSVRAGRMATARGCLLALGHAGGPAAEARLIDALQTQKAELHVIAAQALGEAGSVAAVPALGDALHRYDGDRAFAAAAEHAIDQIQSRLAGADAGRLSLTDAQAGEISLAHRGGEVSLPAKRAPRRKTPRAKAPRKPAAKRKRP
jgi:hypothetical protein